MTESDDQLGSLFFYMLVVLPITSWILHPGRFDKRKAIAYAVLFLAAIATAHVVQATVAWHEMYLRTCKVTVGLWHALVLDRCMTLRRKG